MKAVVWTQYGPPDVLQYREVEKPSPKHNEVLVKIHATAVTAGDCEMRTLKVPPWIAFPMRIYVGFSKPTRVTILGSYLAGEIETVGRDVKRFTAGDQIFGTSGLHCGGYAEYICLPEEGIMAPKPAGMTFEEAAPVALGGLEALHFLRKAAIRPGQTVLINGAGGTIGTYAVQLAKYYGAEVTGVDSTGKLDMLRSIGADHVIDYSVEDFTRSSRTYDVLFDVVLKSPFSRIVRSLNENGTYLMTNPTLSKMLRGAWVSRTTSKKVNFEFTQPNTRDLIQLKELIEAGRLKTVIDRTYPLEDAAEAHRYVETGQKKGNVILTIPEKTG